MTAESETIGQLLAAVGKKIVDDMEATFRGGPAASTFNNTASSGANMGWVDLDRAVRAVRALQRDPERFDLFGSRFVDQVWIFPKLPEAFCAGTGDDGRRMIVAPEQYKLQLFETLVAAGIDVRLEPTFTAPASRSASPR